MEATAAAVVSLGFDAVKIDSCGQFRSHREGGVARGGMRGRVRSVVEGWGGVG